MFYLYIIESIEHKKWYIGSTGNLEKRLAQHNNNRVRSSKAFSPYKIVYTEKYKTRSEAMKRELQIKRSGIIRKQIKMALSSNG